MAGEFIPDPAAGQFVPDPEPRSALGEIGAGVARAIPAAAESVAGTIAGAQESQGQKAGPVSSAISDWAQRKLAENAAQPETHGPITNFIAGIPQAVGGSAAMIGANLAGDVTPVPLAAGAATGAQQYAQTYHESLAEAKANGQSDADANAYAQKQAAATDAPPGSCLAANNGTFNDLANNFTFPSQDIITRYRWFGGFKLKLSVVFLTAELDIVQHGTSHDTSQPGGATDSSATQESFSLAAGFDF